MFLQRFHFRCSSQEIYTPTHDIFETHLKTKQICERTFVSTLCCVCCCSYCCFIIAIVFFFHYCSSAVQHFGQRLLLLTVLSAEVRLPVNTQYLSLNKQFHYYDNFNPSFCQFTKALLCRVSDPLVMVSGYMKSSRDKFICAVTIILAITASYDLCLFVCEG